MTGDDDQRETSAHAPLIRSDGDEGRHGSVASDDDDVTREGGRTTTATVVDSHGSKRTTYLLVATAGLSGLLFGYDTGIISSTLLYLPSTFPSLSTTDKSLITSSTSLAALLSSPLAAPLSDAWGRKPVVQLTCALFGIGAVVQALAGSVGVVVAGRAVVGAAVGAASAVVPLYVAEIAAAEERGRLVTVQSLFVTGGQVLAYLVGWACGNRWRLAVGLGAVPALLQGFLMGFLVESPRFLVLRGKRREAKVVLGMLGMNGAEEVLERIEEEVAVEKGEGKSWRTRAGELFGRPGNRRALTIACLLQGLQQLCGFNVLMYFSATIFSMVGFHSPVVTSLSIAGTNFLFTVCAFSLIDSVGRRRILLVSIPLMVVFLALCSVCFIYLPGTDTSKAGVSAAASLLSRSSGSITNALPTVLLVCLQCYVAAYALGLGCVPWQQSELFPLNVRSLGSGLATATNWSSNFVVGITFLPMMATLGSSSTFALYAVVCFVGWFLVYFLYPETAGLELEDVGALLAEGWGVGESSRKRRLQGHVRVPQRED